MRILRNVLILTGLALAVTACGLVGTDPQESPGEGKEITDDRGGNRPEVPGEPEEPETPTEPSTASLLLALVNEARAAGAQCGASWRAATHPLALNAQLVEAAQAHSDDMLAMKKMSHTGSDGSNPGDRIARTGYKASWWGENIASGYRSIEQVMNGWMGSPGHCNNIMNSNYTEFGAGEAGYYWTQVFGRPR